MNSRLLAIGIKNLLLSPSQRIAMRTDAPVSRPTYIKVAPTFRCIARCAMCHFWQRRDQELDTGQWRTIMRRMREFLGIFHVGISGGEPFVRDDMQEILRYCSEDLKLMVGVVSNGYFINEDLAKKIINIGLFNINISLDSLDAETHNRLRGINIFHKTIDAIKHLYTEKERTGSKTAIIVKTIILNQNLDAIIPLIHWTARQRLNGILLQPLEHTFGDELTADWHRDNPLWYQDPSRVTSLIDEIITMKKSGAPILNTLAHLQQIRTYVQDPTPQPMASASCPVGVNNFTVVPNGDVFLCTEMDPIGNVARSHPAAVWKGEAARQRRRQIRACKRLCSLTCHVRLSLRDKIAIAARFLFPDKDRRTPAP